MKHIRTIIALLFLAHAAHSVGRKGDTTTEDAAAAAEGCGTLESFWDANKAMFEAESMASFISQNEPFAKGGFGQVYNLPGTSKYVFKYMSLKSPGDLDSFETETRLMKKLASVPRNIKYMVTMHSCFVANKGEENAYAGIVMEKLGPSLNDQKAKIATLSNQRRIELYLHLGRLLDVAHDNGLCHNDFKPANVLSVIGKLYTYKLADFGLSCKLGARCGGGTPFYDAPEKSSVGNSQYVCTSRIDSWALLATIVEIEIQNHVGTLFTVCTSIEKDTCPRRTKEEFVKFSRNRSPAFIDLIRRELGASPEDRTELKPFLVKLRGLLPKRRFSLFRLIPAMVGMSKITTTTTRF